MTLQRKQCTLQWKYKTAIIRKKCLHRPPKSFVVSLRHSQGKKCFSIVTAEKEMEKR